MRFPHSLVSRYGKLRLRSHLPQGVSETRYGKPGNPLRRYFQSQLEIRYIRELSPGNTYGTGKYKPHVRTSERIVIDALLSAPIGAI